MIDAQPGAQAERPTAAPRLLSPARLAVRSASLATSQVGESG